MDKNGKEVLKPEYNEISRVTELEDKDSAYLICSKNGQYGLTKNEKIILANEYQSIQYVPNNKVFLIEKSKKYGATDLEGKIIVPIQYKEINITGIYLYAQDEQGVTVYDTKGEQVKIDSNTAIINTGNEKYKIRIKNEESTKYELINQEGKQLIQEAYNYMEYLYDNYFIVSDQNGKLGIIDDKGNVKVDIDKDSTQKVQNTDLIQATLTENKTIQLYSKEMKMLCELQNATIEVNNDTIKIYNDTEIKYFDKKGKELKNTEVYSSNKLFVSIKDEKYGFVDNNNKVVVDYKYDKAYEFNENGFAAVKKDGKWGTINEQGQEVISPSYELEGQLEPSFIGKYYKVTYGFGEFYYTNANISSK